MQTCQAYKRAARQIRHMVLHERDVYGMVTHLGVIGTPRPLLSWSQSIRAVPSLHHYSAVLQLTAFTGATLLSAVPDADRCQGQHLVIAVFYVIHVAGAAIGLVEPSHLAVKCKEVAALQRCNDARQDILEAAPRNLRSALILICGSPLALDEGG